MRNNDLSSYLENLSIILFGIFLLAFPLAFTELTTELFILPKQILLGAVSLTTLLFFGAKLIADRKVKLRRTPFDLPLLLLGVFTLLSSLFSLNRADALTAFVPLLFGLILFYLLVNSTRNQAHFVFLISSFVLGATLASALGMLSFFKVYFLPYAFAKTQTFTPLGSLLDHSVYLLLALPAAFYFALPLLKTTSFRSITPKALGFLAAGLVIVSGLGLSIYEMVTIQKPTLLPLETGFQTAFAAISQDAGRIAQGFFVGSGFGTYLTDFTRFKQAAFNLNPDLWSFTFFRSSSFILELLATTGVLGIAAFVFLLLQAVREIKEGKNNPLMLSLLFVFILAFIIPFSFILQTALLIVLALFSVQALLLDKKRFFEVELYFVAFKKGLFPLSTESDSKAGEVTKLLPVSFFVLFLIAVSALGFYSYRFVASDVIFKNSLVAASENKGIETYNNQTNAINLFPYRDGYHRVYSQTNLALANSLAASVPQGGSPSAQVQQTIVTLIQQAINSGRRATEISPQNVLNWQNLSSIYRSLIGFGQNAESFSLVAATQAVRLDPNNPQRYLDLGGLYYQLGQWEQAQRQFQVAVNLKPDFANAYYNLGHALEQKGELQQALLQYETVRRLVTNDKTGLQKIEEEIKALQAKIGTASAATGKTEGQAGSATDQAPLGINQPPAQLPRQRNPIEIPPPQATESAR